MRIAALSCQAARFCLVTSLALTAPLAASAEPARYDSPDAAVAALIAALEARSRDDLLAVFGAENEEVILSGDPEQDRDDWTAFYRAYSELNRIAVQADGSARLYVGRQQEPFPVSMIEGGGGWFFDAAAAAEEIALARIGRNELDVIDVMRRYVAIQAAYRRVDHDGDGVMEFAASILGAPGKRDGLFWPEEPGTPASPLGDIAARAAASGYSVDGIDRAPEPFLGYYFQILQKQGTAAPGGALDYLVNGNMVAGHALLAFPAGYRDTGVMSFIVGENGVVYEADLGEATLELAAEIDRFDPTEDWLALPEE
ncbi:MAG: DUF2950 family protein [Pseudomonadota bacterium]